MPVRIYIGTNRGLPNLGRSLSALMERINRSGVPKDNLIIVDSSPDDYEYPALNRLWLDSQGADFDGLYLHCKGASKTDETQFQNGLAWMNYMADGVLDRHQICRDHLARGADLVGSMWYRHFKGNFFWFKSSYVRTLASPYTLNKDTRYAAEYWCSQAYWQNPAAWRPKVKNLCYLPVTTDSDFLALRQRGYEADFQTRLACPDVTLLENTQDFSVYDDFSLTAEQRQSHQALVEAHANYDRQLHLTEDAGPPVVERATREELIGKMIKGMARGAEIGVQRGEFSRCMLHSFCGHLVLVDAWRGFSQEEYRDGANVPDVDQLRNMAITVESVQDFPGRYDIVRDLSVNAANRYPDGHFDFIYLDANHRYESVVEDLKAWAPKVKKGGLVCGHDYANGEFPEGSFGVKRAVNEYFGRPPDVITNEKWPTFFYRV